MKSYYEENLYELNDLGFSNRLIEISRVFNRLVEPSQYQRARLYYIVQDDFKFLKVGISTNPHRRMLSLQTGNPKPLILLFFRDAERELKEWSASGISLGRQWHNIQAEEQHEIEWLYPVDYSGHKDGSAMGEWIELNERSKRILVRKGRIVIENLCKKLGLNYSDI
jgi:hypothetical protein